MSERRPDTEGKSVTVPFPDAWGLGPSLKTAKEKHEADLKAELEEAEKTEG